MATGHDDSGNTLPEAPSTSGALVGRNIRTELFSKDEQAKKRRLKEAHDAYGRGRPINVTRIRDRKLRRNLKSLENKVESATLRARDAEILLENPRGFLEQEGELERTFKVRQDEVVRDAPVEVAKKRFELKLDQLGPYLCDYSRNGRELLLAGRKGHVATMDWREGKLLCELQLGETVKDIKWLHSNQYFSVAQKSSVYIYDRDGVEVHCLRKHVGVTHLEFLPYHFLLTTLVSFLDRCHSGIFYTDI